jgi:radical SAM superfamily enzyme YgiQ (UPF0313 family)
MIEYGFESGSQKMLNIMDKGVTVEQNRNAALWTKEAGIYTSPAFVLGMPGETEETVNDSIKFLQSLDYDFKQYQWSFALPIPGSPLYDFAKITKAIEDEDEFLSSLTGDIAGAGTFHINLTDEPDRTVVGWPQKMKESADDSYFNKKYRNGLIVRIMKILKRVDLYCRRGTLLDFTAKKIKSLFIAFPGNVSGHVPGGAIARFRKKADVRIDNLLKDSDYSILNRDISLKRINGRLLDMGAGHCQAQFKEV